MSKAGNEILFPAFFMPDNYTFSALKRHEKPPLSCWRRSRGTITGRGGLSLSAMKFQGKGGGAIKSLSGLLLETVEQAHGNFREIQRGV